MMTATTTASLIATTTWLKTLENLMPPIRMPITTSAITIAGRSTVPSAADPSDVGISKGVTASRFCR